MNVTYNQWEDERVRKTLHESLQACQMVTGLYTRGGRTIVMKKCQISVQKAEASMLATQMTAPAASNG